MIWRRTGSEEDLEEYRRMKRVVKRMVKEVRKRVNKEWTLSITDNFKDSKKKVWKGVNEVRKEESLRLSSVRNLMRKDLTQENDIEGRWREYFVQLLISNEKKMR